MPAAPSLRIPDAWLTARSCLRTLAGARAGVISCGIMVKRGTGWDFRPHRSDHYSVVWCLRGHGRFHDHQGRVHHLAPGDLFHRHTDREHGNELDPQGQWVEAYIGFGAPMGIALAAMTMIDPEQPVARPGLDLDLLRRLLAEREALAEAADQDLPRMVARLLGLHQELLVRAHHHAVATPHDAGLDRACRRLADEPRVSLHALARENKLSYERFRKLFRARLGVSPHDYRIRRRIDRARAMLHERERSIQAIATALGYANPFQFSTQFKRLVGLSPAAYRRG